MQSVDEIRRIRLAMLVAEHGKVASLAAHLDRSEPQVHQWLKGLKNSRTGKPRGMLGKTCRWIEQRCGKPDGWMDQPPSDPDSHVVAVVHEDQRRLVIPLSNAWGSMGVGAPQPENEIIVDGVAVSEDWLRQSLPRISHPSKLAMITAFGHSMAPTFEDGDTLIVDRGVDQIKDDGVFVAAYDDELYIKRFQRRPTDKTLLMKSDNPHYETIVIDTEKLKFEVLGRVVWVWNGKKL